MPDPFRHYEGVPVLDLPADPPSPTVPASEVLRGAHGSSPRTGGSEFLSQLLFYSAAISATKVVPSTGYRYALRVNPSSGNLHPTEFHFISRGMEEWPDGLYHYRPSSHMAEKRATGTFELGPGPLTFVLTSIAWREAWKYRDRAYRYCLHDIGHAWQALALAARAMGRDCTARGAFSDDEISENCRLHEDEWPMLLVEVSGPVRAADRAAPIWYGGEANQLSEERIAYRSIDEIHAATKHGVAADRRLAETAPGGSGEIQLPAPATSARPFGETVRGRRSALDFRGGREGMSLEQLSAILDAAYQPLAADFASTRFIQLYLYAHRIHGLEPGVYRYWPERGQLEQIRAGDQRVAAAGLSLGQDLAGNACVAFSMIAGIERAVRAFGDRGYRYVYFEAGAIGQRLYIAAEALGLAGTGIGAFFDEQVHRYLDVDPRHGQVVYHFAIGHPVVDSRIVG